MIIKKPYKIVGIIKDTPSVFLFKFKAEDGTRLSYEPGMFAMVFHRDADGKEMGRAFSFASMPEDETLEFAISMIHGRFTHYLDTAQLGDAYYITGPYGQFKMDAKEGDKVLYLAGGTGLAPFLSMFRHLSSKGIRQDMALIYSVKHPDDIIVKEELEGYNDSLGLRTIVTVTREENAEGWNGEKGHIDSAMISRHIADIKDRTCYLCGPLAFVKAVKAALIELGVDPKEIKADVWG
jgi:NAD(P)H-flavin reductase